jgi:hypothetical protein
VTQSNKNKIENIEKNYYNISETDRYVVTHTYILKNGEWKVKTGKLKVVKKEWSLKSESVKLSYKEMVYEQ